MIVTPVTIFASPVCCPFVANTRFDHNTRSVAGSCHSNALTWRTLLSSDDGYREVLFEGVEEKFEHFTDLGGIALDFSCLWQCDAA